MNPPEPPNDRLFKQLKKIVNDMIEGQSKGKMTITIEPIQKSGNLRIIVESSVQTSQHFVFPMH